MSAIVHAPNRTPDPIRAATPGRWRTTTACFLAALSGVVAAAVLPRGPVTGRDVAGLIAGTFLVGLLTGRLVAYRSFAVVAPLLHLIGWELARATLFRLDLRVGLAGLDRQVRTDRHLTLADQPIAILFRQDRVHRALVGQHPRLGGIVHLVHAAELIVQRSHIREAAESMRRLHP